MLFSAFHKKGVAAYRKNYPSYNSREELEHVLSIIYSLFVSLEASYKDRLVFKFIDQEFEGLHQLLILHVEYGRKVEILESDDYLDRLDGGLYMLQLVDAAILFCGQIPEIASRMPMLLSGLDMDILGVMATVQGTFVV